MFTGIIEEIGRVVRVAHAGAGARVTVEAARVIEDSRDGDSIAVDGVCLTALAIGPSSFEADCSAETLRRTSLGSLRPGTPVNLERAMAMGARLGGHLVQGHIEAVGTLVDRRPEGESEMLRFRFPAQIGRYMIHKGSIAVSGISLTVAGLGEDWFEVACIPVTLAWTTLGKMEIGTTVNIETDLIAKYVERLLGASGATRREELTVEGLREMGY